MKNVCLPIFFIVLHSKLNAILFLFHLPVIINYLNLQYHKSG